METRNSPLRERGFTLIEILAVIAILALLSGLAMTAVTSAQEKARVTACKLQQRDLVAAMKLYVDHRAEGRWPKESGIRFWLTLVKKDEITGKNTKVFLCPGTQDDNDEGRAYEDIESADPTTISYAGPDLSIKPIDINRLSEIVIIADDNDGRGNHKHSTVVTYADGTQATFDFSDYEAELPGLTYIPVGPDSPVEALQALMVD